MKNLTLLTGISCLFSSSQLNEETVASLNDARLCLDAVNRRVYMAQCEFGMVTVRCIESTKENDSHTLDNRLLVEFPIEYEDSEQPSRIVHCRYLAEYDTLCLAISTGELYTLPTACHDTMTDITAECVGHFASGIKCMSWSPDEELLVIVTGADDILLMTSEFEVLSEKPLHTSDEGEDKSVNVGWGKKETQFHGSLGKQAALTPSSTTASSIKMAPEESGSISISWRGDGNYYACSSLDSHRGHRLIRVFNREGLLQNTSEPTDALSSHVHWRPSGNWITTTQHQPHRQVVLLFERNGLKRHEFPLLDAQSKVKSILWNADSTVLALWLVLPDGQQVVQLWTTSNYEWYLKQNLPINDMVDIVWDTEQPLKLHLLTTNAYQCCQFVWDTAASPGNYADNASLVAVIHGYQLLLTPFKVMNVPPPMSAYTITSQHGPIDGVSYVGDEATNNDFIIQSQQRHLELYTFTKNDVRKAPQRLTSIELPLGQWRHAYWMRTSSGQHLIIVIHYNVVMQQDHLAMFTVSDDKKEWHIDMNDMLVYEPLDAPILRLSFDYYRLRPLLQDVRGQIYSVDWNEEAITTKECSIRITTQMKLPEPCPWINALAVDSSSSSSLDQVVGLSANGKLYYNDQLINASCTSFLVHYRFLLYTTFQHELHVIPLLDVVTQTTKELASVNKRKVERGARLVLAHAHGVAVVLQMPRGNLETIHPRAMVLASVAEQLDSRNYRAAFIDCRRHRVDINVLHARHPTQFIEDLGEFIEQLGQVDYLNLFMSNLSPDLTDPMPMAPDAIKKSVTINSVNTICDTMINYLTKLDEQKYLHTILISYIRKSPVDVVGALSVIRELQKRKAMTDQQLGEAIKFISVMVDFKRLYDEALGMYDFMLVLLIIQNSHLDPREHIPFLNELRALPLEYRHFRIDDHLGRHEKAMINLWSAGDEYADEWINYVTKHQLYVAACEVAASNPMKLRSIHKVHADYLREQKDIKGAGQAYQLAHEFEQAIECYLVSNQWRSMFTIAHQQSYTRAQLAVLARKTIDNLSNDRKFSDAATIADEYLQDTEMAVSLLVDGGQWMEAGRKARAKDRSDLIETCILSGLEEGVDRLLEDMETAEAQLDKQYPRLLELRKEFLNRPIEADEHNVLLDDVEIQSSSTAVTSQFSRFTLTTASHSTRSGKSSKSKKREGRKKERGRKGTVYEEQYLMDSLQRLRERIVNMKDEVEDMLTSLIAYEQIKLARQVRSTFTALITRMGDSTLSDDLLNSSRVIPPNPLDEDKIEKEDKQKYKWTFIPL